MRLKLVTGEMSPRAGLLTQCLTLWGRHWRVWWPRNLFHMTVTVLGKPAPEEPKKEKNIVPDIPPPSKENKSHVAAQTWKANLWVLIDCCRHRRESSCLHCQAEHRSQHPVPLWCPEARGRAGQWGRCLRSRHGHLHLPFGGTLSLHCAHVCERTGSVCHI